jgi:hypothetical protein
MGTKRKGAAPAFAALTVEGSLIAPAMLVKIASQGAEYQKGAEYAVPPGLTLREEISRYFRIGQALFKAFRASETPSEYATLKFIEALLTDVFGFADLTRVGQRELNGQYFALTLEALDGRAPIVVVPPSDPLDRASPHLAAEGRRRSAVSAIQDWLNASEGALWGLCTNGLTLRLVRDNESLTRPAYIEADLVRLFEDEAYADFALLWLLIHASRFGAPGTPVTDCPLEWWRDAGAKEGVAAREKLRGGFEDALHVLGNGFLSDQRLRERLVSGELPLSDYFGQLLHLAYRLIFLFVAEDRDLLHQPSAPALARKLYAEGYSVSSLRERAIRRANWDAHEDRWQGLVITFEALRRGEPMLGLPALGGLFGPLMTDDLMAASLPNRALMEAIYRLAWLRDDDVLMPVNWHDMETEELGSVYEGLLELTPRLGPDGRSFFFAEEGTETKGNARKTSGSYYTPDSLVQALLDSALDPVLDRAEAEADDAAEALLTVTVIDPACGSGHFLLGALRRIATRVARARAGGVASAQEYRHALRDVARRCIHGVDRNPMAVELTKVALWIETVEPGKPLGFLDANIRCGDALLGIFDLNVLRQGIPDEAYKPLTGDDKNAAKVLLRDNRAQRQREGDVVAGYTPGNLAHQAERILDMPEDDLGDIEKKRQAYEEWLKGKDAQRGWMAANLYVAAFLRPKRFRKSEMARANTPDGVPTTVDVRAALSGRILHPETAAAAMDVASSARAFHWPLEFPAIIAKGGFDCVLGNPPWERIKLQEPEFLASRAPEIAEAPNAAARGRMIAALAEAEPGTRERALFEELERARRTAEASSVFTSVPDQDGGRFPYSGSGDANTYSLFIETALSLVGARGSAGLICPAGFMTDARLAQMFHGLFKSGRIRSFFCFDNKDAIFPAIHRDTPFGLLTLSPAGDAPTFCVELTDINQLVDDRRRFQLSSDDLELFNPNTKTAPTLRSRADADLMRAIYKGSAVLAPEASSGAGWGARFARMVDMAQDSSRFADAQYLRLSGATKTGLNWIEPSTGAIFLPLYEGKMVGAYDHRSGTFEGMETRPPKGSSLPPVEANNKQPGFEVQPWYWVPRSAREEFSRSFDWPYSWSFGYRFGTNPTNDRTIISAAIPEAVTPHVFVQVVPARALASRAALLLANLNGLVTDYVCRLKMSRQGLDVFIVKQLPILPPSAYSPKDFALVIARVLELTYTSHSMASFARDLGYSGPPFAWDEDRRALLRAELDAFYAKKYGLTRDELRYILDPADVMGPDYPSETFRVLKKNEIAKYGEYRTARLVLQAWDRMERGELLN